MSVAACLQDAVRQEVLPSCRTRPAVLADWSSREEAKNEETFLIFIIRNTLLLLSLTAGTRQMFGRVKAEEEIKMSPDQIFTSSLGATWCS